MRANRFLSILILLLFTVGLGFSFLGQNASAQTPTSKPVVRAVLFYRSQCRFCQQVVATVIPPLLDEYAGQLEIFRIDVSLPDGDALFTAAIEHFNIKIIGVPTLIVGDDVLIGGIEIPLKLPGIIESALSQGGIDWPDIPGLSSALSAAQSTEMAAATRPVESALSSTPSIAPTASTPNATPPMKIEKTDGLWEVFTRDPLGNSLSTVVLIGIIISVVFGIRVFLIKPGTSSSQLPVWIIPTLCVIGCGVAGYLWYVEATMAQAICGPIGHCQTVQESEYSRLFGILPVGALGVAGYVAIIITWLIGRTWRSKWAELAGLVLLGITALGTLFSIYLTFLEPFIIGASCLWCLTSAVLMTALFHLNIAPGKLAYTHLLKKPSDPAIPGSS
jgi:uncharacterized membrane protein